MMQKIIPTPEPEEAIPFPVDAFLFLNSFPTLL